MRHHCRALVRAHAARSAARRIRGQSHEPVQLRSQQHRAASVGADIAIAAAVAAGESWRSPPAAAAASGRPRSAPGARRAAPGRQWRCPIWPEAGAGDGAAASPGQQARSGFGSVRRRHRNERGQRRQPQAYRIAHGEQHQVIAHLATVSNHIRPIQYSSGLAATAMAGHSAVPAPLLRTAPVPVPTAGRHAQAADHRQIVAVAATATSATPLARITSSSAWRLTGQAQEQEHRQRQPERGATGTATAPAMMREVYRAASTTTSSTGTCLRRKV